MAQKENTLSPQQRQALFSANTRKYMQMMPSSNATVFPSTMQFTLPKARFLSRIFLRVQGKYTLTKADGATITAASNLLLPYQVLRRVSVDFNNGFMPYVISGLNLAKFNMARMNASVILPSTTAGSACYFPTPVQSSGGTENTFDFTIELPITLNQRDLVGLYLLQADGASVTLSCDLADIASIIKTATSSGSTTYVTNSVTVTPMLETFSVPAKQEYYPDISVVKLVNERSEALISGGNSIQLDCGTIYRKMILTVLDSSNANDGTYITSDIEIKFNQADTPIKINPVMLRHLNQLDYGTQLPTGVYIIDLATAGIPNMAGSRDYIDTDKLSEFWINFTTSGTGTATVVTEKLARLSSN